MFAVFSQSSDAPAHQPGRVAHTRLRLQDGTLIGTGAVYPADRMARYQAAEVGKQRDLKASWRRVIQYPTPARSNC